MKYILSIFILSLFFQESSFAQSFPIKKGTNISHWLSQTAYRPEEVTKYFTKRDVEFLASQGFDHLRIPIDEEEMWDEQGKKKVDAFKLLHNALQWCKEYKLKAIVDLHILRSHHFIAEEKPLFTDPKAQEKFFHLWEELSGELKKYPTSDVAYELMNEPVADNHEDWNKLVKEALKRIRKAEPKRFIVIGSNLWQKPHTFDHLFIPENDKYIILSFHFYDPLVLTHYKASWVKTGKYDGPINYPGTLIPPNVMKGLDTQLQVDLKEEFEAFSKEDIRKIIDKPIQVAKKYKLQLYCGEWGCFYETPRETRLKWFKDVVETLNGNNIAWATWGYKGGFGIKDDSGKVDEELIRILVKE